MRSLLIFIASMACAACASDPGVAPIGPNTYVVSRQAATGFPGMDDLKVKALREANQFCIDRDKTSIEIIDVSETKPPYIFGNYPRTEVQFHCVAVAP